LPKIFLVSKGYVHINRDTLKTKPKCLKNTEEAVAEGKSVVVDNTNPTKEDRAAYIKIAEKAKIPVRCYILTTELEMAHHLNFVREVLTEGNVRRIPDVGYNRFKSVFQEPDISEGFSEIKKINFIPKFENDQHKTFFLERT